MTRTPAPAPESRSTTPFVRNFPYTGVDDNGRLRGAYTRSIGSIIESIAGIDGHSTRLASQVCRVTGFASISACPHVSCTPLSAPILLSAKLNLRQGRRKRRAVLWEARAQLSPCTARGQAPRTSEWIAGDTRHIYVQGVQGSAGIADNARPRFIACA